MRNAYGIAVLTSAAAISVAGLAAGVPLATGTSRTPAPWPHRPQAGVIRGIAAGPTAIVIGDPGGDDPGPKVAVR